jgi:hypothetical protein
VRTGYKDFGVTLAIRACYGFGIYPPGLSGFHSIVTDLLATG